MTQADHDSAVANVLFQHGMVQTVQKRLSDTYVYPAMEVPIRQFMMEMSLPMIDKLEQPISAESLVGITSRLGPLSQLCPIMMSLGFYEGPGDIDADAIRTVSTSLVPSWDKEYFSLRSVESKSGQRQTPRKDAKLLLRHWPALKEESSESLERARAHFLRVKALVEGANMLANTRPASVSPLEGPNYDAYRIVESIWRAAPKLIRASDNEVIRLSAEFIAANQTPLLITAPAGFGKSSFCRHSAPQQSRRDQRH
jgi:hypothetical protein